MAAALRGALVLIATMTPDAAEAQADVSGPAPKGGNGSGDNAAELAKKLQNPVADLISAPIQNNWDFGIGPADAMRYTANVQPVIPFSLNQGWNLITRTIMPFIHAESPVPGGSDAGGSGDIVQSDSVITALRSAVAISAIETGNAYAPCSRMRYRASSKVARMRRGRLLRHGGLW
ncbi:MAG: hypothetical protein ACREXX_01930 [Gammaproteobacteria bacterium]